jgi:hypothetical protein
MSVLCHHYPTKSVAIHTKQPHQNLMFRQVHYLECERLKYVDCDIEPPLRQTIRKPTAKSLGFGQLREGYQKQVQLFRVSGLPPSPPGK